MKKFNKNYKTKKRELGIRTQMPSEEIQNKVNSFIQNSIQNPNILENMSQEEQQQFALKYFNKKGNKKEKYIK